MAGSGELLTKINCWLQGDDASFEAVYYYYHPRLFNYALKYLRETAKAEDLATEVLVKMWQRRTSITSSATFENYLFTIARNSLIRLWQQRIEALLSLDNADGITDGYQVSDAYLYKELEGQYQESLHDLPEQRRKIFLLHREANLSYREIAEQLKISPKTVENQMSAALKQLRADLSKYLNLFF